MKHIVNIAGMAVVAGLLCAVTVLGETRLLYETISGLPEGAGTLEEWIDDFARWGVGGIVVSFSTALLWYAIGQWVLRVERPRDCDRRPIWIALTLFPLLAAVAPIFALIGPGQGGWLAYSLFFANTLICYYISTALFSPSSYKYTPVGAAAVRAIRERAS